MARRSGLAGVSRLRRTLKRMPPEFTDAARKSVSEAAELIKFQQLRDVPVETGDLAQSIEIRLGSDKLSAEIGPGARTKKAQRLAGWRAKFTEFGTEPSRKRKGGTPAKPFVVPSLEKHRGEVIQMIDDGVDRALAGFNDTSLPTDE